MDDIWTVTGADNVHYIVLPVSDESHQRPIQQEVFELLGARKKVVIRGFVLGREGSLQIIWKREEADAAIEMLDYLSENRGPHYLTNPFGQSAYVEFEGPEYKWLPVGHLQVNLNWIEVEAPA
jgi:hypothetical protein